MSAPESQTKIRAAILCGGRSGEHEISLRSARSIVEAIDRDRFDISIIGIDKHGTWQALELERFRQLTNALLPSLPDSTPAATTEGSSTRTMSVAASGRPPLADIDVVFPVLHGTYGEDGCMQGLLELADAAYAGANVLGSAIGMDKDVQKRLLRDAGVPIVPFVTTTRWRLDHNREGELARIRALPLPVFVKPANLGSSVGVSKVSNWSELPDALATALEFDHKILVEQGVDAREIECAVLGNDDPEVSVAGEIDAHHEFYSYEAKYIDDDGATLLIPAPLTEAQSQEVRALAARVFTLLECSGMARVDCFLERGTGKFYVNEINTIPGFTSISMYPKLWQASGLPYQQLITRLLELAIERHERQGELRRTFTARPA